MNKERVHLMIIEKAGSDARQRVLNTAEELFMKLGYNAVTLRDIANALQLKQASLYYHFPGGKEQLFIAVAGRAFDRHRQGMEAAVADAPTDLRSRLRAVAAWFESQPPINLMGMVHADMPALGAEEQVMLGEWAYRAMFTPLRTLFADAQQAGEIRMVQPDLLAGFFLTLMDSLNHADGRVGAPPRQVMVDEVVTLMLDGLLL